MIQLGEKVREAAAYVRSVAPNQPRVGIVLGTGLGSLADQVEQAHRIPYESIPHFPTSTVDTHAGELVMGMLAGVPVVALSGRFHFYEGYTLQEVTFPIRVARELGIHTLIVSNAAGGLNPQFRTGDLMLIADHINFLGDNPLIGPNDDTLGPRFPDMCEPYSNALLELAETKALELGIKTQRGVYLACSGPCLETRAEYRFMRLIGADAVGMSTVPEVIVAVHAGLRVLGFSAITDECFPDALEPVNIEKIIATANAVEPKITRLVTAILGEIDAQK
ncbi:MAG: purine-nucleoside phosphorylase [Candidatus Hydrogenedentes bacterium]|nr:purine-nucleoside phosphorylase [Candidatus Hydrogenedentota bacterium]